MGSDTGRAGFHCARERGGLARDAGDTHPRSRHALRSADARVPALALAAAVEARKASDHGPIAAGDLRLSAQDGAVGDAAYTDRRTGEIIRQELAIPLTVLRETAAELLAEGGNSIRRLLAGLLMPDWPEGTRRALSLQVAVASAGRSSDATRLDDLRLADAENFADDE